MIVENCKIANNIFGMHIFEPGNRTEVVEEEKRGRTYICYASASPSPFG
jgi:hypothetical protein